jgi:hypothetical protein
MPRPRFRVRTLIVAVATVAVTIAGLTRYTRTYRLNSD